MEKYNNWKLKFYTIWAGQAVSLITSAILQMAIIFYLTEKTGSAMVLSMASLVGFLPYAVFGPAIGVLVDRHDRKKIMIGADLTYIIHSGFISGYQNRYGDNLKPPTNVYHRMTA